MGEPFILLTGIVLLGGFLLGFIAEKIGLPRVTGYLAAGLLLNPELVQYIPKDYPDRSDPVVDLCLGFITFEVGFSLSLDKIRRFGKRLLAVSGLEALGAYIFVCGGFLLIAPYLVDVIPTDNAMQLSIPFSLLLAALASPTDPSATLATMHQYHAKGPVSETILGCAAFDDVFTLLIFSISFTLASIFVGDSSTPFMNVVTNGLASIAGAVGVGAAAGMGLNYLIRRLRLSGEGQLLVMLLAAIGIAFGVSQMLAFDELLGTLTVGILTANFNVQSAKIKQVVERYTEELIFIFFFVLSAMHLQFDTLGKYWYYIVLFVVLRTMGKYLGSLAGLSLVRSEPSARKYTFTGLLPQGGIVIGLALMVEKDPIFDEFSAILVSTIMGTTIIHEFLGPILARWGLIKSGEVRAESSGQT
jgi:Kef-type K+ transport system membrane component KefB